MTFLLVFVMVLSGGLGVTESQKQTDYPDEYDDSPANINDTFPNPSNHSFPLEDDPRPPSLVDLSEDFSSEDLSLEGNTTLWNSNGTSVPISSGPNVTAGLGDFASEVEPIENGTRSTEMERNSTIEGYFDFGVSNGTLQSDDNSTKDYYEDEIDLFRNGSSSTTESYQTVLSNETRTTVKRSTLFDWEKSTTESNTFSLARATTIRNELSLGQTTQRPGYFPTPTPERTTTIKLFKESVALAVQPFACKSFERLERLSTPEVNVYSVEGGDSLNLTCMSKKAHKWVTEAPIFNKGHPEMNVLVGDARCDFAFVVLRRMSEERANFEQIKIIWWPNIPFPATKQ